MSSDPIPFLDLRAVAPQQRDALITAFTRVLDSGWFVMGEELKAFETEYAQYCGARFCVGVGNGLDALTLSLRALDIGPGDEVIVPSNTYIATWLAITHAGATPVPVEPDPATFNIAPELIEAAMTRRTRAVLPVHLYGQPADMDRILDLSRQHGVRVIEDAAQAHGARHRGQRLGAHGDAVAWSFYPGKNLGALGDGGAITTNDESVAERLRKLRNYGSGIKYHNDVIGYNSRLDEVQAALLRVRLPVLDKSNQRRAEIARLYMQGLADTSLTLPHVADFANPAWHLFVVRHPKREALRERLAKLGVNTVIHYPIPPHLQPAYAAMNLKHGALPVSEAMHDQVLSLPIGPTQTNEQTAYVIDSVKAVLALIDGSPMSPGTSSFTG